MPNPAPDLSMPKWSIRRDGRRICIQGGRSRAAGMAALALRRSTRAAVLCLNSSTVKANAGTLETSSSIPAGDSNNGNRSRPPHWMRTAPFSTAMAFLAPCAACFANGAAQHHRRPAAPFSLWGLIESIIGPSDSSFRDGALHQTRNLEIPVSMLRIARKTFPYASFSAPLRAVMVKPS